MKEESDSLSIPYNFGRCFNNQCSQASKCLRNLAAQHNTTDSAFITIVNPTYFPKDGKQCEYFKNAVKIQVAWGLKKILNKVPYENAVSIRNQLIGYYGKQDITGSIVGNVDLCPKIKIT